MQSIEVHKVAEDARFNGYHLTVLMWCFGILIIDGYDLAVVGVVLPSIMKEMGGQATVAGFMASSGLFGMVLGAVLLGTLAERIGRRWAISICVFLFSVFTAAAGLSSDPVTFSILRFIAGIGMGGAVPNVAALMSEYAPKKMRNFLVALMCCGYAVGSIIAVLVGKQFLESYGWRVVFIVAGAPVLLIPFILKYMPESLSFMVRRRDYVCLCHVLRRLRPGADFDPQDAFTLPAVDTVQGSAVGRLFGEGRGLSTLMFWIAGISGLFMLYALSSWLVKLMGLAGYDLGSSLNFLLVFNAGAFIGAVVGGWVADRLGIKWVTFASFIIAAVSLLLFGHGVQPLMLLVAVVGASTQGTYNLVYTYMAQFYPASIRSTGLGFATGVGRIGAVSAPIVIGFLISMNLPLVENFMVMAAAALVGATAIALINERASVYSILGEVR